MSYWWVNHRQTHKSELKGGYIWSPFKNNDGSTNQSYLNLDRVEVNDLIFSYARGNILAIGVVSKKAVESPRPTDFGDVGNQWSSDGWLVELRWINLETPLAPKDHLQLIVPLLPPKYSPIKNDGNGNQGIYLAEISTRLGDLLVHLSAIKNAEIPSLVLDTNFEIEEQAELEKVAAKSYPATQRTAIISARLGQGFFRRGVETIEDKCRLTGISEKPFLIASHIKPWKDSSDEEKLDGHNGLLLSPHVDKLFDKGYISFSDRGNILIAHAQINGLMVTWKLDINKNVGGFSSKQNDYLRYHREMIFAKRVNQMVTQFKSRP